MTKFSVLRFHSDNKSIKSKKSKKSQQSGNKAAAVRRQVSEFDAMTQEKQPTGLLDFKVDSGLMGKGIFAEARIDGFTTASNQHVATSRTQSDSSFQIASKNLPNAPDKENPSIA